MNIKRKRKILAVMVIMVVVTYGVRVVIASYPNVMAMQWSSHGAFMSDMGGSGRALVSAVRMGVQDAKYLVGLTWLACTMAAANAAIVANIAVQAALVAGVAATGTLLVAITAYGAYKGWEYLNGQWMKPGTVDPMGPTAYGRQVSPAGTAGGGVGAFYGVYNYPTYISVGVAVTSGQGPGTCLNTNSPWNRWGWAEPWISGHSVLSGGIVHLTMCPRIAHADHGEPASPPPAVSVTPSDWSTGLGTDVAAGVPSANDVVVAAAGALADPYDEWREKVWPAPGQPAQTWVPPASLPVSSSSMQTIADALKAGVTPAKIAEVAAQDNATRIGDGIIPGNPDAVTAASVAEGIRAADEVRADDYQDTVPSDPSGPPEPGLPEKKSISTVLDTFKAAVAAIPGISALTESSFEISGGSPVLDLPLGSTFGGGSISVNFSQYEWLLDLLGSMLLGFVTIRWTMYLFEG